MRRALVTGAAGFIGRVLVERLEALGWDVRATTLRARCGAVALDVRDRSAVFDAVDGCEAVFHLAGVRASETTELGEAVSVNTLGVANVLAAAAARSDPRPAVVLLGSAEEYGLVDEFPLRESSLARPVSAYGASKLAATVLARASSKVVPVVVLRPSVVYGPGQPSHQLVSTAVRAAVDDSVCRIRGGTQTRDLVYVSDVAEALILAADRARELSGEVINVGSGIERSVRSIVDRIFAIAGTGRVEAGPLSERPGDVARIVFDTRRARDLLGWTATTDLDEGIRRALEAARHA